MLLVQDCKEVYLLHDYVNVFFCVTYLAALVNSIFCFVLLVDFPCEVDLLPSVDYFIDPKDYLNTSDFSLEYISKEEISSDGALVEPSFGGHQTLEERETSFHASNQKLHCGFVQGPGDHKSTGFDLDKRDESYMKNCVVAVSSCIFGSSDFLRRPTSKKVNERPFNSFSCPWCPINHHTWFHIITLADERFFQENSLFCYVCG